MDSWPLTSLRQSFLDGSLTRLLDPDTILRGKLVEFVSRGDFGLASGPKPDGTYQRVWFDGPVPIDEGVFEPGVFLLLKTWAKSLKTGPTPQAAVTDLTPPPPQPGPHVITHPKTLPDVTPFANQKITISGQIPAEVWNRLGTKLIPKLREGLEHAVRIELSVTVEGNLAQSYVQELQQVLNDLGLTDRVQTTSTDIPTA